MKLETLKEWLERIGIDCSLDSSTLGLNPMLLWKQKDNLGYILPDGTFFYTSMFTSLSDKERGQIQYLIDKWRGAVKYEAIVEFGKAQGFE